MNLTSGQRAGVFAAAASLVIVLGIGVVVFVSGRERSRIAECTFRLTRLSMAVHAGDVKNPAWDALPSGSAFWLSVDRWPSKPTFELGADTLRCPLAGRDSGVDFRGPARSLRALAAEDPMGADRDGNHGPGKGGNVLLRNGVIQTVHASDALWLRAAETTRE